MEELEAAAAEEVVKPGNRTGPTFVNQAAVKRAKNAIKSIGPEIESILLEASILSN